MQENFAFQQLTSLDKKEKQFDATMGGGLLMAQRIAIMLVFSFFSNFCNISIKFILVNIKTTV